MLSEIKELQVLEMQDQLSEIHLLPALKGRIKMIYDELATTEIKLSELKEPIEPVALTNEYSFLQRLIFRRKDYLEERKMSKQAQEKYKTELKEYNHKKSDYERARENLFREIRELEEHHRRIQNTKDRVDRIKVASSLQELGILFEDGVELLKENGISLVLSEEDRTIREDDQEFELDELRDMGKGIYSLDIVSEYIFCPIDLMGKVQEEHPGITTIGYEGDSIKGYEKILSELIRQEKEKNKRKGKDQGDGLEH